MHPIHKLSVAEQTAMHVREGIRSGRWRGELPGVLLLAKACDVSKEAMRAALHLLEAEGLISPGHAGAKRRVLSNETATPRRAMHVAILRHNEPDIEPQTMRETLYTIRRELEAAGHTVIYAAKSLTELRCSPARIAKLLASTPADAWIVAAPPREVVEFFATQAVPVIALGGRCIGAAVASVYTDAAAGYTEATKHLLALGHRRIVMIGPSYWRLPTPGSIVQAFTAQLAAHGITASDYNVPHSDNEATASGLRELLESIFSITPPTALIFDWAEGAAAAIAFLAQRGLSVPRDVSLVSGWAGPELQWFDPPVAHLRSEGDRLVRRIVRWVRAVARGRADRDSIGIPATFVPGGTLGPAR